MFKDHGKWLPVSLASAMALWNIAGCASADLHRYRSVVVSDQPLAVRAPQIPTEPPPKGVRVTYLGVNGYLLQAKDGTVMVDPYFTRRGPAALMPFVNLPIKPDETKIAAALQRLPAKVDLILVTHGHFDHLLDVPFVAHQTKALVAAPDSSLRLARAAGLAGTPTRGLKAGGHYSIAGIGIETTAADHNRVFNNEVLFHGRIPDNPARPARINDWLDGDQLAYVIEMGGRRIYVESGGREKPSLDQVGKVDLAILGAAVEDSRRRFPRAVKKLRPAFALPTHQDSFDQPLEKNFRFGPKADFEAVQRSVKGLPTKLILLEYGQPWTLR